MFCFFTSVSKCSTFFFLFSLSEFLFCVLRSISGDVHWRFSCFLRACFRIGEDRGRDEDDASVCEFDWASKRSFHFEIQLNRFLDLRKATKFDILSHSWMFCMLSWVRGQLINRIDFPKEEGTSCQSNIFRRTSKFYQQRLWNFNDRRRRRKFSALKGLTVKWHHEFWCSSFAPISAKFNSTSKLIRRREFGLEATIKDAHANFPPIFVNRRK